MAWEGRSGVRLQPGVNYCIQAFLDAFRDALGMQGMII
jgi:hypothetical protein